MERDGVGEAEALSAIWSLAAAGLREADGALETVVSDGALLESAERALRALDPGEEAGLREAWRGMLRAVAATPGEERARERARVLGHAVRGPCPPYELEYGPEHFLGKSHRLGDVAAFYRAFGVEVSRCSHEREDHVALQAEFLSLLALKRSLAESRGETGRADVCRDAERRFLEEHIGRFVPSFARRIASLEPDGFLAAAARFAAGSARVHAGLVGARPGNPDLELREIGTLEEETITTCSTVTVPGACAGPDADGGTEV